MPEGGRLAVELHNYENDQQSTLPIETGPYVKLSVIDTGTGIAKEHLTRIFDPYFTTKQTGNGLGLASTYSIIDKHKGHIQVQSTKGKGTTFTIYLPAIQKSIIPAVKDTVSPTPQLENCRILVLDDDRAILNLMKRMLRHTKAEITTTLRGEETIKEYQAGLEENKPYTMAILDLTIPGGMGGEAVAAHILQLDPQARLIVSSGYAEDPILANYRDYGFCDVLSKPYTKVAFLEAIGRIAAQ
jgi:CheY-like chemotaxis protein